MFEFTNRTHLQLIQSFNSTRYTFQSLKEYLQNKINCSVIIFRHDVDLLPENSLRFAKIEFQNSISGSYYFRAIPQSWNEQVIKEVSGLGHEIGYHYETMDTANGDVDRAWDIFRRNLDKLRKLADVRTICMHGSPMSKYDNRYLWNKFDYRSVGIIGEPYYDVDFDKVFYLTDTGRRWDGWKVSVRDKVPQQEQWTREGLVYHTTNDIIRSLKNNTFPDKAMITFHPQRWHDNPLLWTKELFSQNIKNIVKCLIVR